MDELPSQAIMRRWWAMMGDIMATNPDGSPVTRPSCRCFISIEAAMAERISSRCSTSARATPRSSSPIPRPALSAGTAARANAPLADTPYRALDAAAIEGVPARCAARCPMRGAHRYDRARRPRRRRSALVDGDGPRAAGPRLRGASLDAVAEAYRAERAAFAETFSPFLPLGLNLGRQFFFLEARFPRGVCRSPHGASLAAICHVAPDRHGNVAK